MAPSQFESSAHGHMAAGRVVQLDSLRGIAAATVVAHHFWAMSHFGRTPWYLVPLTAGHEAVILFFVLSGYVLSLPFWEGRQSRYSTYLIRRIFRIYVPFMLALFLSAVGCSLFYKTRLPLTEFYLKTWQNPVSISSFVGQLSMPDRPVLNGAIWTLRYEMELSVVFPLVCWFLSRSRYLPFAIVVVMRVAQSWLSHTQLVSKSSSTVSLILGFLYYAPFFVCGGILARERALLLRLTALLKQRVLYVLLAGALLLYFHQMLVHLSAPQGEILTLLGALMLMVFVQDPRAGLGLTNRVCQYLGRVSYSMYLVHYIVLFAFFDLLYRHVSLPLLAGSCLMGTLGAAHVFCIGAEEPALRLGKYLSGKVFRVRQSPVLVTS